MARVKSCMTQRNSLTRTQSKLIDDEMEIKSREHASECGACSLMPSRGSREKLQTRMSGSNYRPIAPPFSSPANMHSSPLVLSRVRSACSTCWRIVNFPLLCNSHIRRCLCALFMSCQHPAASICLLHIFMHVHLVN
jgi:hypothetical protein